MDTITKRDLNKALKETEGRLEKVIKQAFSEFYESVFLPHVEQSEKDHQEIKQRLDESDKDHEKILKSLERNREEHDGIFQKLDSIEKKLGNHDKRIKKLELAISS